MPKTGTGPAEAVPGDAAAQAQAARLIEEGNVLEDAGRMGEAHARYEVAVRLAPAFPRAHLNLGNALLAAGDVPAAVAAYAAAIERDPSYAAAHFNLGNAHLRAGRTEEALACYAEAVRLKPDFADAHVALGNVQDELRRPDVAAASYRRALALRPGYAEVHYNLGNVLHELGETKEAESSLRRAVALRPDSADAHHNLGLFLQQQGRGPEALRAYRRALELRPGFGAAAAHAFQCANQMYEWKRRKDDEQRLAAMIAEGVTGISSFFVLAMDPPEGVHPRDLQRRAAKRFAEDRCGAWLEAPPLVDPRRHVERGVLRIGYLSADFYEHATMHLIRGVLAGHDRARFAVYGYHTGTQADGMTELARRSCDVFREIGALDDQAAAKAIAADDIDILVDLKGFTQGARMRIGALRPAPVLVNWLGYPASFGHPRLADYLVGDVVVTPPEEEWDCSETLALMPHSYYPNDRERRVGPTPTRREAGLPETGFVFCSMNQSYKLSPEVFDVWCRLLAAVPGSVLWLLEASATASANLWREAEVRGIDPTRLVFAPRAGAEAHLGRLALADLAIDTYPYTSHTTGCDALWAGVPLVTKIGETFVARVAASLLHAVGLPELVTRDWAEFLELAKSLALEPERLAAVRHKLAANRLTTPLFDTPRFTRDLERLYRRIWEQHARGERALIRLAPEG